MALYSFLWGFVHFLGGTGQASPHNPCFRCRSFISASEEADTVGDDPPSLVPIAVRRQTGPYLFQIHVVDVKQHLAEYPSVAIVVVEIHDGFHGGEIRQVFH